jgi:uncharacterized glyoxalase superfamily protein PhnB
MLVNRSAPTATVVPVLIYEDVAKAIEWLCATFGFRERLRVTRQDGTVIHAQLVVAEGAILLGRAGGPYQPPRTEDTDQYVLIHVADADAHFLHAKRLSARIVSSPTDMPFGERSYTALDFAGHRWTFSQHIADVVPESWGAVEATSHDAGH